MQREVLLASVVDTENLGRRLAEKAFPGAIIGLVGELGAGKSTLVRSIATELGVDPRIISSPTFGLIHEYTGRLPVYHCDVYRLSNGAEFMGLGFDEYLAGEGICLIEWADRVLDFLPAHRLIIELSHHSGGRRAMLSATGERYETIIQDLPIVL